MMRWIRWSYVAPRLATLALLAVALYVVMPAVIRWSLTSSGRVAFGAKVDVSDVECSILDSSIVVRNLAVADSSERQSNLFAADRLALEIEPSSLAKKRLVVRRGSIEGLEVGTPRASSRELDEAGGGGASALLVKLADSAADRGKTWLAAYWSNLRMRVQEDLKRDFQSVALADELTRRWPAAYEKYDARLQDILSRGGEIEAKIRAARENPLRNLAELKRATQRIDQLDRDLGQLVDDLRGVAPDLQQQRQAVWDAWQEDQQTLENGFTLDPTSPRAVTDYLLQEELSARVKTIVTWIERARRLVPAKRRMRQPKRHRGVNFHFAGVQRHPEYLIRSLEFHGMGRNHGQRFELTGTILGLSTEPSAYGRPTVVRISGRGAVGMEVLASLDRTGDLPLDRFVIRCGTLQRPDLELGRPDAFALTLAGGRDMMHADLTHRDWELTGTVVLRMDTPGLRVAANGSATGQRLAESLNARLAGIDRVEATLQLGGSVSEPTLRLESTLGGQVLAAVQASAIQEIALQRQELKHALRQYVQDKLNDVDRLVAAHRRQLERRLDEQQSTLQRLASETIGFSDRPTMRLTASDESKVQQANPHASTFQR